MPATVSIAIRTAWVITGLLLALTAPGLVRAQGVNRVSGLVTDPSGAALVGALIEAKELSTNATRSGTSNDRGYYLLQLPIGVYTVTVSCRGFDTSVREKVPVDVGADVHIDFSLPVASAHQSVEVVAAGAAMLTPDSSQVTTTVNNDLVLDSPVALASRERNSASFLAMTPGWQGSTSSGRLNGGQGWDQSVSVDGASLSPAAFATGTQAQMIVPTFAIQEFEIIANNPEAQDGRTSNGAIKYVMKSGTNNYHGSAFDYLRNQDLDARNFFSPKVAEDDQNEYGVELGGPVVIPHVYDGHNKWFFYTYYDGYRYTNANTAATYSLFTPAMRVGDFSAAGIPVIYDPNTTSANAQGGFTRTPYPGNIIPTSQISPISRYYVNLFPAPNRPGLTNNYLGTSLSRTQDDQGLMKINRAYSRGSFSASYGQEVDTSQSPGAFGPTLVSSVGVNHGHRAIVNWDSSISPTLLNHFGASFNRWHLGTFGGGESTFGVGTNTNKLAGLAQGPVGGSGAAAISAGGYTFPTSGTINFITHQNWRVGDDFTWHTGAHSFQFGGSLDHYSTSGAQNNTNPLGSYTFSPLETGLTGSSNTGFAAASFLLGNVDTATWGQEPWETSLMHPKAVYAQDKWKLRANLTLSYGLRWDYEAPVTDKENRLSTFNPNLPNPGAGNLPGALEFAGTGPGLSGKDQFALNYYKGIQPRIGLAYNFRKNTVLRAGYTINTDEADGIAEGLAQQGYYTKATVASLNSGVTPAFNWAIGFPNVPVGPVFNPTIANGASTQYQQPNSARLPMVENWNFGIQQMLPGNIMIDISYLGMGAHHLGNGKLNYNQLNPIYLSLGPLLNQSIGSAAANAAGIFAPYPGFTGSVAQALVPYPQYQNITLLSDPIGNNGYNALQVKFQKRLSHGLTFLASFNYSKNLTDADGQSTASTLGGAQNYYNSSLEKAVAALDVPLAFIASFTYELPFGTGKPLRTGSNFVDKYVIGGWKTSEVVTVQNGTPLGITTELTLAAIGAVRANVVPGGQLYGQHDRSTFDPAANLYLNKAAFSAPAAFTFGDSPRLFSQLRGFGTISVNAALLKSFAITERVRFTLRPEFFNLLNNVNFSSPTVDVNSTAFGKITAAGSSRMGQVSATLSW
jgi:hypothetical protein